MKTTEVFVEQVLIGFLVLLIGALPFAEYILSLSAVDGPTKIIGSAIGIAGVAYLLGIPFDRFADSLLSSLERRHRLSIAISALKNGATDAKDPFPENLLKVAVRQANDGSVSWMEYLRSRIRLARAVAVFTPGLTIAGILAAWPLSMDSWCISPAPRWAVIAGLGLSFVIYATAFLCALRVEKGLPSTRKLKTLIDAKVPGPKTSWKADPIPWFLIFFIGIGAILSSVAQSWLCAVIGAVGVSITVLTGWSWWRISKTYRNFLADFDAWQRKEAAR